MPSRAADAWRRSGSRGRAASRAARRACSRARWITSTSASISSRRLCGGTLVAMPTAMPGEPFASRFGNARRQHDRLLHGAVEVRHEVDRLAVDVAEHLLGERGEARLGVAVGGGGVAVDRAEVALAVDQRVAHGEVLGHAHHRVVDRAVAVRVVVLEHLADDAGGLRVARAWRAAPPAASRRGCGGARASGRRARRAARG